MKEQLISFDTAKLAKEKGFDIKCKNWGTDENTKVVYLPTQSLLQKWLREEKNIEVTITSFAQTDVMVEDAPIIKEYSATVDMWDNIVLIQENTGFVVPEHYHFEENTYEETLEKGLQEALTMINPA